MYNAFKKSAAFAAPYPGKIIPVNMAKVNGELLCQKDAFLCAAYGTQIGIAFNKKLGTGFFGSEGFILQRLRGDGMAFIHAGGTVVKKTLKNETLRVDTGCLVAFTAGIDYSIESAGSLESIFFSAGRAFFWRPCAARVWYCCRVCRFPAWQIGFCSTHRQPAAPVKAMDRSWVVWVI